MQPTWYRAPLVVATNAGDLISTTGGSGRDVRTAWISLALSAVARRSRRIATVAMSTIASMAAAAAGGIGGFSAFEGPGLKPGGRIGNEGRGKVARMPWVIEELRHRVEVEFDPAPMGPREMGELADALRPYFEDPRFTSIVIRGLEDQRLPPPRHLIDSLKEWGREFETDLQLRTRLEHRQGS